MIRVKRYNRLEDLFLNIFLTENVSPSIFYEAFSTFLMISRCDGRLKQPNLVYLEMKISNEILRWPHQEDDDDDSHNHQLQLSNISVMVQ